MDLSSHDLSALDPRIAELTELTSLDVSNNNLVTLPVEITTMRNLKRISVSGNPVAKRLSWSHLGLTEVPGVLALLSDSLEELDLSHNQIAYLNASIFTMLPNLVSLDVSHNLLQDMPAPESTTLRTLVASNNQLYTWWVTTGAPVLDTLVLANNRCGLR